MTAAPGMPAALMMSVSREVIPADGRSTADVFVDLVGADDSDLAGVAVDFSTGSTHLATVMSDEDGRAMTRVVAPTTPQTITVTAQVGTLSAETTIEARLRATVTFSGVEGVSIDPSGMHSYDFGSVVPVSLTPNDPAWTPSLTVDGISVTLVPPTTTGGPYRYELTVTGDHQLSAGYFQSR